MPALKPRAKTLLELADGALFLFDRLPLNYDEKARDLITNAQEGLLPEIRQLLESLPEWTIDAFEIPLKSLAEAREIGLGKVAQPLRAALTGRSTSPGIFDVLFLLGREECLQRVDAALTL
jgi:glutamyl-tRNA synthetase